MGTRKWEKHTCYICELCQLILVKLCFVTPLKLALLISDGLNGLLSLFG